MSVPKPFPREIPEETRRIVESWLNEKSLFAFLGQHVDEIIKDADFAELYASSGRPGVNSVVLTLVTVFQFLEDLPDRAAAEQVRSRMDWKYVLRQELTWAGFNYSDLCNFRKRLVENEQEGLLFEKVLVYLKSKGFIKKKGKQRTDATHVLGQIRSMSRLELVLETMRVALSAVVSADAKWFLENLPASYSERYQEKRYDYRMKREEIDQLMKQAGQDGRCLLEQLEQMPQLVDLEQVQLLKRVLAEQFLDATACEVMINPDADCDGGTSQSKPKDKSDTIQSPHEPDARYAKKRGKGWQGYKVQVTDSADEEAAHFIIDIQVTPANESDHQALDDIQDRLAARDLSPDKHYVDQAYMSGEHLASSREHDIDLRGYVQANASSKAEGFRLQDFDIDIQNESATCPAGKHSVRWSPVSDTKGVAYRASFGEQCRDCPFFNAEHCTSNPSGRRLDISRYHDELQKRRHEMQDPDFKTDMHTRHGIEGTLSELVRTHGLRQARYRGQTKMQFQAYFTAVAFNLKHLATACDALFFDLVALFSISIVTDGKL